MNRSRSSTAWLNEHVTDTYVQRARAEGYRSRASYKLMEMDDKDGSDPQRRRVVDLGASAGWLVTGRGRRMQGKGRIIAVDLLEMAPLRGVTFLQGDFREQDVLLALEESARRRKGRGLFFPICPPISGISVSDQARACTWPNWPWSSPAIG
jgi:23S rRNA (uridine2552-2'-O)-methyltransferase